ncbi:(Lyso)-N-acylphosphatidylethanolamine lipase [Frankliniella fusca]|uniref:1-acylglycerol-3-phosphate O-acyltransferase ABHD5 n=1 Tax=Frankliniella fusca TaxID=407009 RepID=A0AAE1HTV8_9NEOP|nr:(Lyso)-N-acylphosphatidylethanolamine lipase [Frankliniella fusca]
MFFLVMPVNSQLQESNSKFARIRNWISSFFQWTPMSISVLRAAEKKILSCLKSSYRGWYVDIGSVVGTADKIWTVSLNQDSPKTPILMLHGLGAGVALWVLNLDYLASHRPVYAIDLLGFGRSSRPKFSSDALEAENQLVKSVEEWRKEMKLEKMVLLGHSMGGFLAASYAIKYPDRVAHLILADPWGFPERPADHKPNLPMFYKVIGYFSTKLNPFWALRAAGPYGQSLLERFRPDIMRKFSPVVNEEEGENVIAQYIFQCNAQNPSGESAFHAMMQGFGWAKNPMINRIHELRSDVPVTAIYGSRSWIDSQSANIKERRPDSFVNVQIISGAGHHVYADKSDVFNPQVEKACQMADEAAKLSSETISVKDESDSTEEKAVKDMLNKEKKEK